MADEKPHDLTGLEELAQKSGGADAPALPELQPDPFEQQAPESLSLPSFEPVQPDFAGAAEPQELPNFDFGSPQEQAPAGALEFEVMAPVEAGFDAAPAEAPLPEVSPEPEASPPPAEPAFEVAPPTPAMQVLQEVKEFAERVVVGKPPVQASFPFSLLIEGMLAPADREKLLDLLARENMGIREVDLEPQFAAGKLLLPRISEFAAVLVIQALRGASVRMRMGPSDSIFATDDTRAERGEGALMREPDQVTMFVAGAANAAEELPLTNLPGLPGAAGRFSVIDAVVASAALKTRAVEAESSSEYTELLEALQRELKYKAFRKGASAVVNLQITLTSLGAPTHYRMTLTGSAVRIEP